MRHLTMFLYTATEKGYFSSFFSFFLFFCWYPHLSNQVVDFLAKRGAKLFESFVGNFLPPSIIIRKHLVCWIILVSSSSLQLVTLHFVEHSSGFFIRFCTLWKDLLDLFIEYKWISFVSYIKIFFKKMPFTHQRFPY